MGWGQRCTGVCVLLKLSWCNFRLECYNFKDINCNPHGNHKENSYRICTKGNEKGYLE